LIDENNGIVWAGDPLNPSKARKSSHRLRRRKERLHWVTLGKNKKKRLGEEREEGVQR